MSYEDKKQTKSDKQKASDPPEYRVVPIEDVVVDEGFNVREELGDLLSPAYPMEALTPPWGALSAR